MKIMRYCVCGSSLRISGPEDRRKTIEESAALFWAGHEGEGHRATDRKGAQQAREKDESIRADVRL